MQLALLLNQRPGVEGWFTCQSLGLGDSMALDLEINAHQLLQQQPRRRFSLTGAVPLIWMPL